MNTEYFPPLITFKLNEPNKNCKTISAMRCVQWWWCDATQISIPANSQLTLPTHSSSQFVYFVSYHKTHSFYSHVIIMLKTKLTEILSFIHVSLKITHKMKHVTCNTIIITPKQQNDTQHTKLENVETCSTHTFHWNANTSHWNHWNTAYNYARHSQWHTLSMCVSLSIAIF